MLRIYFFRLFYGPHSLCFVDVRLITYERIKRQKFHNTRTVIPRFSKGSFPTPLLPSAISENLRKTDPPPQEKNQCFSAPLGFTS